MKNRFTICYLTLYHCLENTNCVKQFTWINFIGKFDVLIITFEKSLLKIISTTFLLHLVLHTEVDFQAVERKMDVIDGLFRCYLVYIVKVMCLKSSI